MATTKLGDATVGTIVKIPENGTLTDYIVVNQGIPSNSSLYDSSCYGTWVLRKDVYILQQWYINNSIIGFNQTPIFTYLNNTFISVIGKDIRDNIKTVKLPYINYTNTGSVTTSWTVKSKGNGVICKAFLLCPTELGITSGQIVPTGGKLSYFDTTNNKRIAWYTDNAGNYNPRDWWTRDLRYQSSGNVWVITNTGTFMNINSSSGGGVRPAFILPPTLNINDNGEFVFNSPPTMPPSLTIPSSIQSTLDFTVQWGPSTDPDGNLAGYQLERSIDSGAWTQIYQGTATSYTDNLPYGTQTVTYRVRAYDTENEYSGYRTSTAQTVINNLPPTAPANITVPTPVAGHTIAITWGAATDPDGTVSSYQLERSVNNSGWAQIFSGNALTYTDTVGGGWGTVAYRVRAVDDMGAAGPYVTGETYTVQNDILYISGPAPDMGLQPKPFTFTFGVGISGSTATVDNISVTASLDGYGSYTGNITSAQTVSLPIDVRTIGAGEHTIHVTADRPLSIGAKEDYTFTVAATVVPDGGYGTLLQDNTGAAVFPQTTAGLVAGLKGKSVGENLAELYAAIEAIQGAVQAGLDSYREEG